MARATTQIPVLACTLALVAVACSRVPNVVLISVDSLRADHVGAYGYRRATTPTLDRLAREGVVFTAAESSTSWTLPAHVAMLTGLPDLAHGVITARSALPARLQTLAERFEAANYRTVGFYSGPFLHPVFGFAQGFERYLDCTSYRLGDSIGDGVDPSNIRWAVFRTESHDDITNPIVLARVRRAIADSDTRRFFFFIHLWDVHYNYIPPPPYDTMFDAGYSGTFDGSQFRNTAAFARSLSRRDVRHLVALYDGEIRSTDDTIGAILQAMSERGMLDDTLVVITSDHGDELLDHKGVGHRHTLYEELVHIPLILWWPKRLAPARVDAVVRMIDVAPTVLDLAGLLPFDDAVGRSLVPLIDGRPEPQRPAVSELRAAPPVPNQAALRLGDRKLIADLDARSATAFDLAADPHEHHPLPPDAAGDLAEMLESIRNEYRARRIGDAEAPPVLDAITDEHLRALGYLE